jgi:LysR family transcriptional regulator, positive regulator for ilvC
VDFRALNQFVALADTLHFGRAAERNHVSASALSRSIQRLETEVGAALFERDNRSVSLTGAGRAFLDYARDTLRDWEAIRNRLMAESGVLRGEVSLYCSVTASYSFLFDILARVRQRHPHIEIKLHTGDPEDAIGRVQAGLEDMAIAARPERLPPGLAFRLIEVSPLEFIVARGHELARKNKPAGDDLRDCPMIVSERGLARARIDRWFRRLGMQPSIYAQVAGNEAIVSMVSLGFGVGVVPRIVLDNSPLADRVTVIDIEPALAPYEVGLVTQEKSLANPLIHAVWAPSGD